MFRVPEQAERRNRDEHSADNVMCWIFSGTWSAEESDVVEFSNSLVCRPHREPPLYFYKLSQQ